ncbi:MAG: T9SS type A sorting domain-containing protein [Cytophagales bacterium]|nr:T9SS type A sorting domain-containing protein [Cytophagales bacterium]
MRSQLQRLSLLWLIFLLGGHSVLLAQCTFTSRPAGGNWSDAATWTRSGSGCTTTIPAGNSTVVIASHVTLNQNFSITSGDMTINTGASLKEDGTARTLLVGPGPGSATLRLTVNGNLTVSNLAFDKAHANINSNMTIKCNLGQNNNSALTINSLLDVFGNYNLANGNVTATGAGYLSIKGCVTGSNGAINTSIIPPLVVCVASPSSSVGCGTGGCNGNRPIANTQNCQIIESLPVRLVSFGAVFEPKERRVRLAWKTAEETDNDFFAIERASDGQTFHTLFTVPASSPSNAGSDYEAFDPDPLPSRCYYRLRQQDLDGTVTYFKIVSVQTEQSLDQVHLYPNPANAGKAYVAFAPGEGSYQLRIIDTWGRTVYSEKGQSKDTPGGWCKVALDLSNVKPGHYFVKVVTGTASKLCPLRVL